MGKVDTRRESITQDRLDGSWQRMPVKLILSEDNVDS